jgi:uncharacterized protein with putative carbohydrate binding module
VAFVDAERVKETSTTTGTGTLSLAGAVAGFRSFVAGVGGGNSCHYVIEDGTDWETGIGTVTDAAPDTLSRDTILASSNGGSAVSFAAGTKNVFCAPLPKAPLQLWQDISPTALTADQNDWNPTGLGTARVIRVSASAAPVSITGLAGGAQGRVLILHNVGTVPVILQREATASSAANRLALVSDVFLRPNDLVILQYDATDTRWRIGGIHDLWADDPLRRILLNDDFLNAVNNQGDLGWVATVSGTGASAQLGSYGVNDATQKAYGVLQVDTGTTTTGRAMSSLGVTTALRPALGPLIFLARVAVEALSTAGEEFIAEVGLGDNTGAGADHVDGIYWQYDRLTATAWRTVTSQASTRTKTTSGKTVDTNYIWLGFIVNAAWTRVDFIRSDNGETWTVEGTAHTANIPSGAQTFGPLFRIVKSAGTTQRNFSIDALIMSYDYSRGI